MEDTPMKPRSLCRRIAIAAILVPCTVLILSSSAFAADPVMTLFWVADDGIYGCAYDPDSPTTKLDIHVYGEGFGFPGTVARAQYSCPWTSDPNFAGHGFWIQYRRPINYWYDAAAFAINAPGTPGGNTLVYGWQAPGANLERLIKHDATCSWAGSFRPCKRFSSRPL